MVVGDDLDGESSGVVDNSGWEEGEMLNKDGTVKIESGGQASDKDAHARLKDMLGKISPTQKEALIKKLKEKASDKSLAGPKTSISDETMDVTTDGSVEAAMDEKSWGQPETNWGEEQPQKAQDDDFTIVDDDND